MSQCRQLLLSGGDELEAAVRRGDIFALMIHHCVKSDNFSEARQLCAELRQFLSATNNTTPITYYLNKELIEALAQGLGVPVSTIVPITKLAMPDNEDIETVDEVIEE